MTKASKTRSGVPSEPACCQHVRVMPCGDDAPPSARSAQSGNRLAVRMESRLPARAWLCLSVACCLGLAGCIAIPTGRKTDRPWLVAAHTNALGVVERLLARPTDHYVMMLISAEGPQLRYPWRTTWRYFMQSADEPMVELPSLRVISPFEQWEFIQKIPGTNAWIAASPAMMDDGTFSTHIVVFDRSSVFREHRIPGLHGGWRLDASGHAFYFRAGKGREISYNLLTDTIDMPPE